MARPDRRARWRRAVYAPRPGMTDGCRVLLLRMLDEMNANGVVSIPRSRLAAELGIAPARVSERIKLARSLGFLDVVRRARPKITAVYQAVIPPDLRGTGAVPHKGNSEVRTAVTVTGTGAVPLNRGSEVRMYPTQEVEGPEVDSQAPAGDTTGASSNNNGYDDTAWLGSGAT